MNRNPIDSLHGENSEQRTEPESRGATRRGPKQERNGDKPGKFTDASNRAAGVVNLLPQPELWKHTQEATVTERREESLFQMLHAIAITLVALAMAPAVAHALELPGKVRRKRRM
jgi:hypothetical protein